MSLTYSQPMALGTKAPSFTLPDVISGKTFTLQELQSSQATVVMFICNHCPYVKHIMGAVLQVVYKYQARGVKFVAISSNDIVAYPQDDPAAMKQYAAEKAFTFPYLYDESQQVARAYGASCTPEFYVFGKDIACAYHGRFDDSSPDKAVPVTGQDLSAALDAVLENKPAPIPQHPSMGCNIKWK